MFLSLGAPPPHYTNNHSLLLNVHKKTPMTAEQHPGSKSPTPTPPWPVLLTQVMVIMDVIHIHEKIKR